MNFSRILLFVFACFVALASISAAPEPRWKIFKKILYTQGHDNRAVSTAGKNVKPKEMTLHDFYDWEDYTTQYKLSRIKPRPYINEIVEVEVNRGSFDLTYRTGFNKDPITASIIGNFFLKNQVLPPPKKKTTPDGISKCKKKIF